MRGKMNIHSKDMKNSFMKDEKLKEKDVKFLKERTGMPLLTICKTLEANNYDVKLSLKSLIKQSFGSKYLR